MNCQKIQDQISLYLDQQLEEDQLEAFTGHIKTCTVCQGELNQLTRLKCALNNLEEQDLPPNFHSQVMAKIKKEKNKNNFKKFLAYPALVAAGLFLFFVSGIMDIPQGDMALTTPYAPQGATPFAAMDTAITEEYMPQVRELRTLEEGELGTFTTEEVLIYFDISIDHLYSFSIEDENISFLISNNSPFTITTSPFVTLEPLWVALPSQVITLPPHSQGHLDVFIGYANLTRPGQYGLILSFTSESPSHYQEVNLDFVLE